MLHEYLSTVALTDETFASLADDASPPVWVCIAVPGEFRGHRAGVFQLNDEVFGQIIQNFSKLRNRRVRWDFEHASEISDPSAGTIPTQGVPAQGWITDLKVGQDGCLYALTEWLEPARSYIRGKKYQFCSPTIRFNAIDQKTGKPVGAKLTSVALTNGPFLTDLPAVAAKDDVHTNQDSDTPEAIACASEKANTTSMLSPQPDTSTPAVAPAAPDAVEMADVAVMRLDLKEKDATIVQLTARAEAAEAEIARLTEERVAADVDEAFTLYKTTRKLTDTDREDMLRVRRTLPDVFGRQFPKPQGAAALAPKHLMSTLAAGTDKATSLPAAHVQVPDVTMLTERFVKDGMSIEDATSKAYAQVQAALRATKG